MNRIEEAVFNFTLPIGYLDEEETLHREGSMRLATAEDEILPLKDPRVQQNQAYLIIILLSRVITKLGALPLITPQIIDGLFARDLAYLQEMYSRINQISGQAINTKCPECDHSFQIEVQPVVEETHYSLDRIYEEIAFIAYYFHWSYETLINLNHRERQKLCGEIRRINSRIDSD